VLRRPPQLMVPLLVLLLLPSKPVLAGDGPAAGPGQGALPLTYLDTTVSEPVMSPNGDGRFDETALTCRFELRAIAGLTGDERSDRGADLHHAFFVRAIVRVLSPAGNTIREIAAEKAVTETFPPAGAAGEIPLEAGWNGRDALGSIVPSGDYTFQIAARFERDVTKISGKNAGEPTTKVFGVTGPDPAGGCQVDLTPPALSLSVPLQNSVIPLQAVPCRGTCDDASVGAVHLEVPAVGAQSLAPVVGGAFEGQVPVPADGPYEFVAWAEDSVANRGEARVNVVCDTTPPVLSSLTPDDTVAVSPALVAGHVEDLTRVTVTVAGLVAEVSTSGDFAAQVDLGPGTNRIEVRAVDEAGNAATSFVTLVLNGDEGPFVVSDVALPRTSFDPSFNPYDPTEARLAITFQAEGRGHVLLHVYASEDRRYRSVVASVPATGPGSVVWDGRTDQDELLDVGDYHLKVQGMDTAGHTRDLATFTATVRY
jgi:flagellar hook assembly protein FlgD